MRSGPFGTAERGRRRRMLSLPGRRGVPSMGCVTRAVAVCASVPAATEQPKAPSDDKRWRIVETRMRRLGNQPDALVEALHSAQEAFGYLDTDALTYVGRSLVGAAVHRVRRRDLLPLLHAQAGRRAHGGRVHRDRVLHQRGERRSWRRSATASGSGPSRRPPTARSRCSRRAASGPAASRPPRSSTARSRAGSTDPPSSNGWSGCDRRPRARPPRPAPPRRPGRAAPGPAPGHGPRPGRAGARLRLRLPGRQLPVDRVAGRPRIARRAGHRRGAGRRRGEARGLPRPVRERPAGPGSRDGRRLHPGHARTTVEPVMAALRTARPGDERHEAGAVLRPPGPDRDRALRRGRPREPRGRRRPRRLRVAAPGAQRTNARRGPRRDHEQRPPGPGRRRVPDRPQVEHRREGARLAEGRDLQRRRGRPRRVHGPVASSRATRTGCSRAWRSPPTPSGRAPATSTAAPSTRSRCRGCARRSARPRSTGTSGRP